MDLNHARMPFRHGRKNKCEQVSWVSRWYPQKSELVAKPYCVPTFVAFSRDRKGQSISRVVSNSRRCPFYAVPSFDVFTLLNTLKLGILVGRVGLEPTNVKLST